MESAFIETKMNLRREVDRTTMYANELESRIMSLLEPESHIS